MGRTRNEISKKNKYYISKHRYLELKHFCLQYPEWQQEYNRIDISLQARNVVHVNGNIKENSGFEEAAIRRIELSRRMKIVQDAIHDTDDYLGPYIFQSVTSGCSYEHLHACGMACCKDMFYDRYHKFFWILDKSR